MPTIQYSDAGNGGEGQKEEGMGERGDWGTRGWGNEGMGERGDVGTRGWGTRGWGGGDG